mmetsp:Transcript_47157/g.87853  ORF Transcript_47157/g.87853 Transcript_47157/m.87853 type:complete len:206 (-) Transcript_47157:1514-2131(-)
MVELPAFCAASAAALESTCGAAQEGPHKQLPPSCNSKLAPFLQSQIMPRRVYCSMCEVAHDVAAACSPERLESCTALPAVAAPQDREHEAGALFVAPSSPARCFEIMVVCFQASSDKPESQGAMANISSVPDLSMLLAPRESAASRLASEVPHASQSHGALGISCKSTSQLPHAGCTDAGPDQAILLDVVERLLAGTVSTPCLEA